MEAVAPRPPLRVAFFGELGSGNTGNDGSFEVALDWVRRRLPDAHIRAICLGPEQVTARFGIPAEPMQAPRLGSPQLRIARGFVKVGRKARDALWVHAQLRDTDWVVIPGAGVLESSWHRAWMLPYALYTMTLSARIRGTRIAMINVGADRARSRMSRWLVGHVAGRADYLTLRDHHSAAALRSLAVEAVPGGVYPDLAFGLPAPLAEPANSRTVGVGLINFFDWRGTSGQQSGYEHTMVCFVEWLLEQGYSVRLLTGDIWDDRCLQRVLEKLRGRHPGIKPDQLIGEPARDLHQLMTQMSGVEVVIGARYHNIITALRMARPLIAFSYAPKADHAVGLFGLSEFVHPISQIDLPRLKAQFVDLYERRSEIGAELRKRLAEIQGQLEAQNDQFVAEFLLAQTKKYSTASIGET